MKMQTVALAGALLCLLYFMILAVYAGITADFIWIWLFFAAVLLLGRMPVIGRWILILFAAGSLVLVTLLLYIGSGMAKKDVSGLPYVIVEGAQVKGTVPSRSLTKRLEKALAYAGNNPDTVLILSGGQGSGEDISEAACMAAWLTEHGLDESRFILEDKSTSTRENLKFSDELTGCSTGAVGIISNNFHIQRSLYLARKLGYTDAYGLPASADAVLQLHSMVREAFALVVEWLR